MAPSQLKQLKASLREHGVLAPQKSKKQRKATAKDGQKRLERNVALEGIRERFNPFEAKAPSRKEKFEVASNKTAKPEIRRPGVTRGLGEERRRDTLLKEMRSRNKVGGMMDRRFGESDSNMTPEQRAAERYAQQAMRAAKKTSMFNLEDASDEELHLTHGGRKIEFREAMSDLRDDFQEDDLAGSGDDSDRPRKRLRTEEVDPPIGDKDEDAEDIPERKKTKNEVMKEIIAKSKMYKAERQAAKEDDDDLREELNKGMAELYGAMRSQAPATKAQLPTPPGTDPEPHMDPSRAAMLAGKSREAAEKEYEANLRKLKLESRSKPSTRTKTEEEKAAEEKARLEDMERKRVRRMQGQTESSDEEEEDEDEESNQVGHAKAAADEVDDAEAFGLSQPEYPPRPQLDVEDEDEFVLDDIIASGSEAEMTDDEGPDKSDEENGSEDDGDDDFINGLVLPKVQDVSSQKTTDLTKTSGKGALAYTFPCPETHEEFLGVVRDVSPDQLATVVQRIRALYHKGLAKGNEEKLGKFALVLTEHISYLANEASAPSTVLGQLTRHLHSMAKTQPLDVGVSYRTRLREMAGERPLNLTAGDLIILTGIGTIFPTSDQFHGVVNPAMLNITRYLGHSQVQSLQDLGIGAYCCSLALQYQTRAERYVPEVVSYIGNAVAILCPTSVPEASGKGGLLVPVRLPSTSLRVERPAKKVTKLSFLDLSSSDPTKSKMSSESLLCTFIQLMQYCVGRWSKKSASPEILQPFQYLLHHLNSSQNKKALSAHSQALVKSTLSSIEEHVQSNVASRRPLLLHDHRPRAIKQSYPQFIDNYNPDRHYDPDRERAELSKLKAEHKKERKGAMRELRKDANFIAREQLRDKKAKDEAYDKKFKRLVAEIQGEEGHEAKAYEREKAKRKGRF